MFRRVFISLFLIAISIGGFCPSSIQAAHSDGMEAMAEMHHEAQMVHEAAPECCLIHQSPSQGTQAPVDSSNAGIASDLPTTSYATEWSASVLMSPTRGVCGRYPVNQKFETRSHSKRE